jgi:hypothetical protein
MSIPMSLRDNVAEQFRSLGFTPDTLLHHLEMNYFGWINHIEDYMVPVTDLWSALTGFGVSTARLELQPGSMIVK